MSTIRNSNTDIDIMQATNTPMVDNGTGGYSIRGFPSHPQTGFVIFIDVLGIKGIWRRKNPDLVINNWKEINKRFYDSINSSLGDFSHYSTTISDTIIITCQCSIKYIDRIFQSLLQPFIFSMNLEFFLRGTISYGMTFLSPGLILGQSLDDAAEWHNKLEWIGITTTPALSQYYLGRGISNITNNYVQYPHIPIKKIQRDWNILDIKDYEGLALNWFNKGNNLQQLLLSKRDVLTDPSVKCKYENTLAFYDYCIGTQKH